MFKRPTMRTLGLLVTLSAGCEDEADTEPFFFETIDTVPVEVRAMEPGRPLYAALVTVRRVPERGGRVLALMKTDDCGRGSTILSLEPDESSVQVVVRRSGVRGALDNEAAARQHGPFAPATSRIDPASLRALELAFEEVEQ